MLQAALGGKGGFLAALPVLPAAGQQVAATKGSLCLLFHYRTHQAWQNSSASKVWGNYLRRSNLRAVPLKLIAL